MIEHQAIDNIFVVNIMKKRLKAARTQTAIMNTCVITVPLTRQQKTLSNSPPLASSLGHYFNTVDTG